MGKKKKKGQKDPIAPKEEQVGETHSTPDSKEKTAQKPAQKSDQYKDTRTFIKKKTHESDVGEVRRIGGTRQTLEGKGTVEGKSTFFTSEDGEAGKENEPKRRKTVESKEAAGVKEKGEDEKALHEQLGETLAKKGKTTAGPVSKGPGSSGSR